MLASLTVLPLHPIGHYQKSMANSLHRWHVNGGQKSGYMRVTDSPVHKLTSAIGEMLKIEPSLYADSTCISALFEIAEEVHTYSPDVIGGQKSGYVGGDRFTSAQIDQCYWKCSKFGPSLYVDSPLCYQHCLIPNKMSIKSQNVNNGQKWGYMGVPDSTMHKLIFIIRMPWNFDCFSILTTFIYWPFHYRESMVTSLHRRDINGHAESDYGTHRFLGV